MLDVDVVIFGGGIAGLWTLSRLTKLGYNAILLETQSLGCGQTIKSQGIIHGGLKYALSGQLSSNVTALKNMPLVWQQCLEGRGVVDLQNSQILSNCQYMWSIDRLTGGVATLFASNTLKSNVKVADKSAWPRVMQYCAIQSKLYQLAELVLDIPSVLRTLATPLLDKCIKLDNDDAYMLEMSADNTIGHISIKTASTVVDIRAQKYVFTAGSGNAQIIKGLVSAPVMQTRPLQMVLLKSKTLLPIYGHCIGLSTVPRITITTHLGADNFPVWYLGGRLAEEGVTRTPAQQIDAAKQELAQIFPSLDFSDAQFATFFIDRAEAKQSDGSKPSGTTVFNNKNYITAWPTKLALAPILAEEVVAQLQSDGITPHSKPSKLENFNRPAIAKPIWDEML